MTPEDALVAEVRDRLRDAADPEKAVAMQAYMKSAMPFRGVPAPRLRTLSGDCFARHPLPDEHAWRSAVRTLWDDARFREERYVAVALTGQRAYRAYQTPQALDLYRHLVVTGAWWDHVDAVASRRVGPLLDRFPGEVRPVILAWARDDDLWLRRTAVLSQLQSKEHTDVDLLREVLEANLEDSRFGREFFIRKAVGWALRQHARTDPDWVRGFVDQHADRLAGLSRREALKHLGG